MLLNIISGFQIEPQIKKTVTKYNKLTTEIIINIHKVMEEVWVQNLEKQAFTCNFRYLLHVHSAPQRAKSESTKTNGDFYNVELCSCILYFPTFNCLDVVLHLAHDHNCNVGSRERKLQVLLSSLGSTAQTNEKSRRLTNSEIHYKWI